MSVAYRNRKKAIARGESVWVTQATQPDAGLLGRKLTRKYRKWRPKSKQ